MKEESFAARLRAWLNNLPIQDPVERRMASMFQVILIGLIVVIILATLLLVTVPSIDTPEKLKALEGNFFGFLVVALPLGLLRRGYFRTSALILITVLFITPALAVTVVFDLSSSGGILIQFTLAIILSGLLVGRRALALVFGLSAALVAFSAFRMQSAEPGPARLALDTAVNFILFNGLIALFVDQFGITLRTALTDALARETELQSEITDRRQAQTRFGLAIESAPNAILMIDTAGRIILVNSQAEKYFGYSRETLVGAGVDTLVPERFRGGHPAFRAGFLSEPQARPMGTGRDLFALRKDGNEFPVEIGLAPIETPEETLVLATIVDITERKLAQAGLQESEERFRTLFESIDQGFCTIEVLFDNDEKPVDYRFLIVNPAFERQTGISNAVGRLMREIAPLHEEQWFEIYGRIAVTGESMRFENPADQLHRYYDVYAWKVGMPEERKVAILFNDITERKRAEENIQKLNEELEQRVTERTAELSQANALLHAMMDNVPDHIFFKDTQSHFLRNSRSQAEMLGLSDPTEVVGKTDFDFFPHAQQAFDQEQAVIRSGKPIVDLEEHVVWPDGRQTWVSTTKVPLRDPAGKIVGIFGIARDITERKQAEHSLRLAKEQVEAANKELEAFSYSVSHDLRAPLRAIDGFLRILLEDYGPLLDQEGKRLFSVVRSEARRMGELIDDLLTFSRLGRTEMRSVSIDMTAMARRIFDELTTSEARSRIDFHLGKLPPASGDPALIHQVWVNLISNAIKFTSKRDRAVIHVSGIRNDHENIYAVKDNGAGFDMEYADKLFGVFQRLHSESEFEGTGVGLAIVQRVIVRHGGRVWAEGGPDKGAAFHFSLPRKGAES